MTSGYRIDETDNSPYGKSYRAIRSWSGSNDPAHKAENAYTCTNIRYNKTWCPKYRVSNGQDDGYFYGPYETNGTKPAFPANSELQLLGKIANEIRGHSFNLGVFIAELPQSLDLVKNTTLAVANMFRAVAKRDFTLLLQSTAHLSGGSDITRKFNRDKGLWKRLSTKDISATWLSIQYGWKPLLSDIYEAMQVIEHYTAEPRVIRKRFSVNVPGFYFDDHIYSSSYKFLLWCEMRREYRIKWVESVSVARSLGLLNPLSVAWEKLPWSFVVDWFIPVGNYLDMVGLFGGLHLQWSRTTFIITRGNKRVKGDCLTNAESPHFAGVCRPNGSPPAWYHKSGGTSAVNVFLDRVNGTSLSIPTPDLKSIEKALSIGHIQNAAALIEQQVSSMGSHASRVR